MLSVHPTMPNKAPELSVILPAFNEAQRILPTLCAIMVYCHQTRCDYEILVVDDGSTDATVRRVQQLARCCRRLRLVQLPTNRGKGAAVATGMLQATGQLLLLADADGATPIAEVARLRAAIEAGADLAIGSRAKTTAATQVTRQASRTLMSRGFAWLVRRWFVPGVTDTQCGFKLFRRQVARHLFARQTIAGFAFDVEILHLATLLRYRIVEVPVTWQAMPGSKVRPWRDACRMLWSLRHLSTTGVQPGPTPERSALLCN